MSDDEALNQSESARRRPLAAPKLNATLPADGFAASVEPAPVVECAEHYATLYWHRAVRRAAVAFLIAGGFAAAGVCIRQPWLGPVGVAVVAAFVVIPHVVRLGRFFAALPCPHCRRPAGDYFTDRSRVHLRCRHCGRLTPTDCIITYAGGPPAKG